MNKRIVLFLIAPGFSIEKLSNNNGVNCCCNC